MGLLASHPLTSVVTGDASLVTRTADDPCDRTAQSSIGAADHDAPRRPPADATVIGAEDRRCRSRYALPVASAQVKSAVLLAGLNAPGVTTVIEPHATRDHSENMLRHFGAEIAIDDADEGGQAISITGEPELTGRSIGVPGDISSAAFPIVAALLRPDSDITVTGVGINPRRTGLIDTLIEMGGRIELLNRRDEAGEPVADIRVQGSELRGVDVPPDRAPSMIDEYPVLSVAAACAEGTTRMLGVGELRVKESDRLAITAAGLSACGITVDAEADSLTVQGAGQGAGVPEGGATVATELDHRIAMTFLVLGMASRSPVAIDDARPIETSFPGFAALMNGLGASLAPSKAAA